MMKKLITSLVLAYLLSACQHHKHEDNNTIFVVTNAEKKDTTIFGEYVCQIKAIQHIELRVLEKGYLQNIFVDEGQFVKKGQQLFQIQPLVYQAEAHKAHAEKTFAEIEYQNTKKLSDSNIVSKNELALSKAKLEKAKADYELATTHLGFTQIKAPFDGIVGRFRDVRMGSLLNEGDLLTTLSDNNKMWVYFNVPEAEYIDYATNHNDKKKLNVKLELANGALYEEDGFVETIEADFNNETGNIAFRASFNNKNKILRHGETGNILMPVRVTGKMIIPQKATFEVLDRKYVYIVSKTGEVQAREIKVMNEMNHIYIVGSGIQPNEQVLVEGLRKVKNGDKIKFISKPLAEILKDLQELKAE
ncbi:MAG: efflux RND transporter periplasmic adaptor subunit [Cytophagales bacterium]